MVEPITPEDCAYLAGDGEYDIEVIGVADFQDRLEWLARGRGEQPTDYACTAVLIPEPEHSDNPEAIAVVILGEVIGYLPADDAERMREAMANWDFEQAACEALIGGGWYRNRDDKGDFQVWLDINPDFTPSLPPVTEEEQIEAEAISPAETDAEELAGTSISLEVVTAPPEYAVVPVVATPPRPTGITLRELLAAAAAITVVLVLVGIAWLLAPAHTTVATSASKPPLPLLSAQQRLEARVALIEPAVAAPRPKAVRALASGGSVLRPVAASGRAAAAIQPVEYKTVSASPATMLTPPAAKPVASEQAKAITPQQRTDLAPGLAAAAPPPRRSSALPLPPNATVRPATTIALARPVHPDAAVAIAQPPNGREGSDAEALLHADAHATAPQADPTSPSRSLVLTPPARAPKSRAKPVAPIATPTPRRVVEPKESWDRSRSHSKPPRRETERSHWRSRHSRPPHHRHWHRTASEEQPTFTPLPPPPATAMVRPLRPGETMATRLFEDGVKEWTDKAIPAAMNPRYPSY